MEQYLKNLRLICEEGVAYPDRTGTGRIRMFGGDQNVGIETYDLQEGLPLVTTRKIFTTTMIKELFGFIRGSDHIDQLSESFWGRWAVREQDIEKIIEKHFEASNRNMSEEEKQLREQSLRDVYKPYLGKIGPMYGVMWRRFPRLRLEWPWWFKGFDDIPSDCVESYKEDFLRVVALSNGRQQNDKETWEAYCVTRYVKDGYDQLNMVMKGLKLRPYSSRHRVTSLHPDLVGPEDVSPQQNVINNHGALAPCHQSFQFMVTDDSQGRKKLNCMLYMSSSDFPVGRPYNIAQYSMLTTMMAHCLDYLPGLFTIVSCDTHVYTNQKALAMEQVKREPKKKPRMVIHDTKKDLFAMTPADVEIVGYEYHDKIDYPVST